MTKFEALEKIRANLSDYDYTDLAFQLDLLFPSIPISSRKIEQTRNAFNQDHNLNFNLFYRARPHTPHTNVEPFKTVGEISYVPDDKKQKISSFGRVNKPEQPVFYCTTDFHVSCLEAISKGENLDRLNEDGEYWLTLGTWKLKDDLLLAEVIESEFFLRKLMTEAPSLNIPKKDLRCARKYNAMIRSKINDEDRFSDFLFFADEFAKTKTSDQREYMTSNYYADRIMNRLEGFQVGQEFDGIIYPSVASGYNYDNLVFAPQTVDKKLQFLWASKVLVKCQKNKAIQFQDKNERAKMNANGDLRW